MKTLPDNCPRTRRSAARSAGFSLLEVLMAVTVLIIIVMVIALVFQQSHIAWGAGTRRAGSETTLRSVVGFIERDLVHAVDATQFAQLNDFTEINNSADYLQFVTLDGTNRMPIEVRYQVKSIASGFDLFRSTRALRADSSPTNWVPAGAGTWLPAPEGACLNGDQPLSAIKFHIVAAPAGTVTPGLPLRVEVEARVLKQGTLAVVSGWSEGRNRPGHPEDKIVASP